jgi:hypothetical protein
MEKRRRSNSHTAILDSRFWILGKPGAEKPPAFLLAMADDAAGPTTDIIDVMNLELTEDEALVLFELLTRTEKAESFPTADPSENRVVESLLCQLEKQLAPPFRSDYESLLAAARRRVSRE